MKISIKNIFKDLVKKLARTKLDELEVAWGEMDARTKEKAFRQVNIDPNKTLGYRTMSLKQMPMNVVNKISAWICSEFFAPGHAFYRHEPRITRSAIDLDKCWNDMDSRLRVKVLMAVDVPLPEIAGYTGIKLKNIPQPVSNKIINWIKSEHLAITKKSFLTVDQAYEKVKVLQRGRILSQESYDIIVNQLKETDIYPFTTKLVSVGIRVASKQEDKSKSMFKHFWRNNE